MDPLDALLDQYNAGQTAPQHSALETAGRSALLGALPTVGAAAAAGLAAAAAPATGGLSAFLIPLAAGLAGGAGVGYSQQKLLEAVMPEFLQQTAEAEAQHPLAAIGGTMASGLPGFRLAPGRTLANVATLLRPAGRVPALPPGAVRQAATELGAQVGVGGLIGAGMPLIEGRTPEIRDIAEAIGFNLLYGGSRFHPTGPTARWPIATEGAEPLGPIVPAPQRPLQLRQFNAPIEMPEVTPRVRPSEVLSAVEAQLGGPRAPIERMAAEYFAPAQPPALPAPPQPRALIEQGSLLRTDLPRNPMWPLPAERPPAWLAPAGTFPPGVQTPIEVTPPAPPRPVVRPSEPAPPPVPVVPSESRTTPMPQAEKMVYLRQQAEARRIPPGREVEQSKALQLNEPDAVKGAQITGLDEPLRQLITTGAQNIRSKQGYIVGLRKFFGFFGRNNLSLDNPEAFPRFEQFYREEHARAPKAALQIIDSVRALQASMMPKGPGQAAHPLAETLRFYRFDKSLLQSGKAIAEKPRASTEQVEKAVQGLLTAGGTKARSAVHYALQYAAHGRLRPEDAARLTKGQIEEIARTGMVTYVEHKSINPRRPGGLVKTKPVEPEAVGLAKAYVESTGRNYESLPPEALIFHDAAPENVVSAATKHLGEYGQVSRSARATMGDRAALEAIGKAVAAELGHESTAVASKHYAQERLKTLSAEIAASDVGKRVSAQAEERLRTSKKAPELGGPGYTTLMAEVEQAVLDRTVAAARAAYRSTSNAAHAVVEGLKSLKRQLGDRFAKYASAAREWLRDMFRAQEPARTKGIGAGALERAQARRGETGAVFPTGEEGRYVAPEKGGEVREGQEKRPEVPVAKGGEKVAIQERGSEAVHARPTPEDRGKMGQEVPVEGKVAKAGEETPLSKTPLPDVFRKIAREADVALEPSEMPGLSASSDEAKQVLKGVTTTKPINRRVTDRGLADQQTQWSTVRNNVQGYWDEIVNKVWNKLDKAILPADAMMDLLDGGRADFNGFLMSYLRKPFDVAYNIELNMRDKWIDSVVDLKKKYRIPNRRGEAMGIVAQAEQEGGRAILNRMGISDAVIERATRSITPQEREVLEAMKRTYDRIFPLVDDVLQTTHKRKLVPVDNYFPRQRDPRRYVAQPGDVDTLDLPLKPTLDALGKRKGTVDYTSEGTSAERGFTIERVPNPQQPIRLNAFDVFEKSMRDVSHFVAMEKLLQERGRLVRSNTFRQKYGDMGQQMILDWMNTVATQGRNAKRYFWLDQFRKNTTVGVIAFRLASQFVHLANLPLAVMRMEMRSPGQGFRLWYDGLHATLSRDGQRFLRKNARETFERGGGEPAIEELSLDETRWRGKAVKAGFYIQRQIDRLNTQATVMGLYMDALAKKGVDPLKFNDLPVDRNAMAQALVEARRAVASPIYKDVPSIIGKGGSLARTFFQFQNVFLDQYSNMRLEVGEAGLRRALEGDPKLLALGAAAIAGMLVIETGIKHYFRKGLQAAANYEPAKEREFDETLVHEALKRIPFMGQALTLAQTITRATKGEQTDVRSGIPSLDVGLSLGQKAYETAVTEPESRPITGMQLAAAGAEALGGPAASQLSEFGGYVLKGQLKRKTAREVAARAGVESIEQVPLYKRAQISRQMKAEQPPKTEEEKAHEQVRGARAQFRRQKEMLEALPKEQQRWVRLNGLPIAGYKATLERGGGAATLSAEEAKRYRKLLDAAMQKMIATAMTRGALERMPQQRRIEYWKMLQRRAHQQAELELERSMRGKE